MIIFSVGMRDIPPTLFTKITVRRLYLVEVYRMVDAMTDTNNKDREQRCQQCVNQDRDDPIIVRRGKIDIEGKLNGSGCPHEQPC
jgi:hypothetical protein